MAVTKTDFTTRFARDAVRGDRKDFFYSEFLNKKIGFFSATFHEKASQPFFFRRDETGILKA